MASEALARATSELMELGDIVFGFTCAGACGHANRARSRPQAKFGRSASMAESITCAFQRKPPQPGAGAVKGSDQRRVGSAGLAGEHAEEALNIRIGSAVAVGV